MRYLFFFTITFFYCKCSSDNNIKKEKPGKTLDKKKDGSDSIIFREDTLPDVEEYSQIYSTLKVEAKSIDSIIVEVTFVNDSTKGIWLYKPILPNKELVENTFAILPPEGDNLQHTHRMSNHRYYGQAYSGFLSTIIPEVKPENLILLEPGKNLSFNMNISSHYNFDSCLKIKKNNFSIWHVVNMPLIEELKHVSRMDTISGMRRPVYFIIGSRNPLTRKRERINFKVPYKPKK